MILEAQTKKTGGPVMFHLPVKHSPFVLIKDLLQVLLHENDVSRVVMMHGHAGLSSPP